MFSLLGAAVGAAYHVVSAFALVLAPLPGGLAAAAAIVIFTLAVRLLLLPLSYYAIRGQASQARLAPQIQALRRRHAARPERLQRELAALYRREGTGMFAGFLPLLLQYIDPGGLIKLAGQLGYQFEDSRKLAHAGHRGAELRTASAQSSTIPALGSSS